MARAPQRPSAARTLQHARTHACCTHARTASRSLLLCRLCCSATRQQKWADDTAMIRCCFALSQKSTANRSSGAKSVWTTDGNVVDGQVRWQHPSGAETLLVPTISDAARRKALSRALRQHVDPAAVAAARRADARAKAQKRATDTTWRDNERDADAKAKAKKRADDPDWRDLSSVTLTPTHGARRSSALGRHATSSSTSC